MLTWQICLLTHLQIEFEMSRIWCNGSLTGSHTIYCSIAELFGKKKNNRISYIFSNHLIKRFLDLFPSISQHTVPLLENSVLALAKVINQLLMYLSWM